MPKFQKKKPAYNIKNWIYKFQTVMNVHGQIAHPSSPFTHIIRYSMLLHILQNRKFPKSQNSQQSQQKTKQKQNNINGISLAPRSYLPLGRAYCNFWNAKIKVSTIRWSTSVCVTGFPPLAGDFWLCVCVFVRHVGEFDETSITYRTNVRILSKNIRN